MGDRVNSDFPPFSRVFVVCSKTHKEDDVKSAFQLYGAVEDVWMVKDRMTKENKGICYVKFDKASAAALAIESLDGTTVGGELKPIKASYPLQLFIKGYSSLARTSILVSGTRPLESGRVWFPRLAAIVTTIWCM